MVSWLAQAQTMLEQSDKYGRAMDERGRKCEEEQYALIGQVQNKMKMLEE